MGKIFRHQITAARGAVTPKVHARIDTQDYQLGMKTVENFLVSKYGGLVRVAGTLDQNPVKDDTKTAVLRPFIFNQNQAYALEFSNQFIRLHTVTGIVGGGTPVAVAAPWLEADLDKIKVTASADVVYIVCEGYRPRKLTRSSETAWALTNYYPENGPWLPQESTTAVVTLGDTTHAVPLMTSLTLPSGVVSSSNGTTGWKVFDRDPNTVFDETTNAEGWVRYDFGASAAEIVDGYSLRAPVSRDDALRMPISWRVEGSGDAATWVVLDAQRDTSDWYQGEVRHFEMGNTSFFRYYQLIFDATGGASGETTLISQWNPHMAPASQTPFSMLFSNIAHINGGAGFQTSDAGRSLRVLASDGRYRWLAIQSAGSSGGAGGLGLLHAASPLPDLTGVSTWQLDAWSDFDGYPAAVAKYKGRLGFFRTNTRPTTGWLSASADFGNHGVSAPLVDDDGVSFTLTEGELDEILWATSNGDDLFLGTAGGIRIVGKRDKGAVFSPSNVEELGKTAIRAGDVDPEWVGRVMLFGDKTKKALHETAFSLDEGGYAVRELTMLAEHLVQRGVKEIRYQTSPSAVLWMVMDDGTLLAGTYDRQQKIFGVTEIKFGGTGVTVESMCILPTTDYDVPMFVVGREVNGATTYRIEMMADPFEASGYSTYSYPIYLNAAARYTGGSTSTITGLSHLEGEIVAVYDITNSQDLGDATVASGQITVPDAGSVVDALVGLRYTSLARSLRPPNVAEDGSYVGNLLRPIRVDVDVLETYGLQAGNAYQTSLLRSEADQANAPTTPALHTGMLHVPVEGNWDTDPEIIVTTDKAYPATVRAIQVEMDRG